jgi:hypothetical protein
MEDHGREIGIGRGFYVASTPANRVVNNTVHQNEPTDVEYALDVALSGHRAMALRVEALEAERARLKQALLTFAAAELSMSSVMPLLDLAAEMQKEDA